MLGAVGNWRSSISICFVSRASDRRSVPCPWPAARPSILQKLLIRFDVAHHLVGALLKLFSRSPSRAALSPEKLPRLLLLLLEALHFLCTRLPTLQISPQVAWPHVHELLKLLGSVLACGPDVEVQGFVNHALRLHVSRGGSWSRSTEPSCESEGALVCRDTAARIRRSTRRGPTFTCGGTSTSGPWILASLWPG